jgi:hypothetical protein
MIAAATTPPSVAKPIVVLLVPLLLEDEGEEVAVPGAPEVEAGEAALRQD